VSSAETGAVEHVTSPPPLQACSFTGQIRMTSHAPGRMRLRVARGRDQDVVAQSIKHRLELDIGARVEIGSTTSSVLIHYDQHRYSSEDLLALLRDLGLLVAETVTGVDPAPDSSTAAEGIVGAFSDLDRRVAAASRHQVDLKLLFPLALGALGVFQLARRGTGLRDVPAYVLLWYAFDSFWKFHHENEQHR